MASTDPFALFATIIFIFPMVYFSFATPTFFLADFNDPVSTKLLRDLFNVYFRVVAAVGSIGVTAYAIAGKPIVALGFILLVVLAVFSGRFFVQQMDFRMDARDAGDLQATRSLRRLHVGGMLYNLLQMGSILVSVPYMMASAT